MFFKYLQHFAIVSLKYFFNLDSTLSAQMFIILLVIGGIIKLSFSRIAFELNDGVHTVKADLTDINNKLKAVKERWENSNAYELLINCTRTLRDNLSHK